MRTFTTSAILLSGALAAAVSPLGTPVTDVADLELRQAPTTATSVSSLTNAAGVEETTTAAGLVATTTAQTAISISTSLSSSSSSSTLPTTTSSTATATTATTNPALLPTSSTTSSTTNPILPATVPTTTSTSTTAPAAGVPVITTNVPAGTGPQTANTWLTTVWRPQTNAAGATLGYAQAVYTQTWAAVPDQLPAAGSGRIHVGYEDDEEGDSVAAATAAPVGNKGVAVVGVGRSALLGLGVVVVVMGAGMGGW